MICLSSFCCTWSLCRSLLAIHSCNVTSAQRLDRSLSVQRELPLTIRGLRTALVEREDFAAGTSSRSTKLVHGGVRYLEKAFFSFDYGQLKLVFEALHERKRLLENAPHLCNALPIMTVRSLVANMQSM